GEGLDPLGGPLGADVLAPEAPDLLRVGLEEHEEEPAAEAVRHPVLEAALATDREDPLPQVARDDPGALEEAELAERLQGLQRIVEEPAAIQDAGEALHPEEARVHHLAPDPLDLGDLGEEAMPAHVEEEAPVATGARMPAHLGVPLQHHGVDVLLHERVRGREPGGAAADDDDALSHSGSRDAAFRRYRRWMVRAEGLEPPRVLPHQGLNLAP